MINKKKIVFKVPEFPHLSETFIVAQIVTALNLGYEIQILTRKRTNINPNLYSSYVDEYGLLDKIIIEDYKTPSNKFLRVLKWIKILLYNVKEIHFIRKYYQEYPKFSLTYLFEWNFYKQFSTCEIIHIQYGNNKHPIDKLKKTGFFKPAVILTFHGHDAFFPMYGTIKNNGYYDTIFEYANLITVNTLYLADAIKDLNCNMDKVSIIPVGVDTDFFYPLKKTQNNSEGQLRLITVGRLDKVKGHHYCVEVVRRLKNLDVHVKLTIIGEGQERKNLEEQIVEHKLQTNICMLGAMSSTEVRTNLWEHDLYLLLGIPVENGRRESQGLATLEAQACGLPAIAFDSGGIKYTIQDGKTGFVCNEFNIDCVVQKIILFNKNRNLQKEMGEQATIFVNNQYAQRIIDQKWESIYKNLTC